MKEVININGQTFFAATNSELSNYSGGKCIIVASHADASAMIDEGVQFSANGANQLIVVGGDVAEVVQKLIGVDVFVIGATTWEQAIELSAQSRELNEQVVCIQNNEVEDIQQLIQAIIK